MAIEGETASTRETLYVRLSEKHLDAVFAVHHAAIEAVGRPDLIKPETREFFTRMLTDEGSVIGAFRDGALIGYGVLQIALPPSEDARPVLGLAATDSLAKLAGASVLPGEWGGGLHDAFIEKRLREARRLGIAHLYATSAPGNTRSWKNLMDAGFSVRGIIEKYGGHLRYVLYRDLSAGLSNTAGGVWCDIADIGKQKVLLANSHAGINWRRSNGGYEILYRGSR